MKVCWVMHHGWAAFTGGGGKVGGAERQQARLARELRERGHEAHLVCFFPRGREVLDDLVIHGIPHPGRRLGHLPHVMSLWRAMRDAAADVYVTQNFSADLWGMSAFCLWTRRPLIFCVASDLDVDGTRPKSLPWWQRSLWRWGLARASRLVVQTRRQADLLSQTEHLAATVLPNGLDMTQWPIEVTWGWRVLWVGNLRAIKRFDRFVELARLNPAMEFRALGGASDGSEQVLSDLPANLTWLGPITDETALRREYLDSMVLVNMSEAEGLPNTFLEAWATGRPVFSLGVDVEGALSSGLGGRVFTSIAELGAGLVELLALGVEDRERMAMRIGRWAHAEYDLSVIGDRWQALLESVQ